MIQLTFTLRTVTPLFLAGADQERAELRAPTFRGLMRYWYRALVGGVVGASERTLQQVTRAETAVFGATDTGSAVSIRVSSASKDPQPFRKESYSRENVSGKDYLLWSMAASGKGDVRKPDRLFFPVNTTFQVIVTSKGDKTLHFQQAIAAFWLLTHIGSIGSRGRRGAGSLTAEVLSGEGVEGLRFDLPIDVNDLKSQLSAGIRVARTLVMQGLDTPTSVPVAQAEFDALAQNVCRIWILGNGDQTWKTPESVLRAMGSSLQAYRRSLPLSSRVVFGLPLMNVDNRSRQASPLLLRVVELQGETYVGMAVLFKTGVRQNYSLIEQWVESFSGRIKVEI